MADNTFNYTTRDFTTIRAELGRRAKQAIPEWSDSDGSDFLNLLIELWSYMGDVMHFYIDRTARESFIGTATQRESLLALANLYDYTPAGISSARVVVNLYNDNDEAVIVPAGTEFSGTRLGQSYSFYTTSYVTLAAGAATAVTVTEGVQYSQQPLVSTTGVDTSNGSAGQVFSIPFAGVDPTTVRVFVAEGDAAREWNYTTRLVNAGASDSVFTTSLTADGSVLVKFGNRVNGRIPSSGVRITASFATSSGSSGNVDPNTVTTISSSGLSGVSILSSGSGSGGSDAETVESLRRAIPRAFRAQERAVTISDFADLALSVGGVAKATASYESNASTGGSVTIYAVPYTSNYQDLSAEAVTLSVGTALRDEIVNAISPVMMLGVAAIGVPASVDLTNIYISMDLRVRSEYFRHRVEEAVRLAVASLFSFSNVDFGQTVTVGAFYKKIIEVEGVDWVTITQFNPDEDDETLLNGGLIQIEPYNLPKLGSVTFTSTGGITV